MIDPGRSDVKLVRIDPDIRLERATFGSAEWVATKLGEMTGLRLNELLLDCLLASRSPAVPEDIVKKVVLRHPEAAVDDIRQLIRELLDRGYLTGDPSRGRRAQSSSAWEELGWTHARDYHVQTFGYPFLEYDERGRSVEDGVRMRHNASERADTDRTLRRDDANGGREIRPSSEDAALCADTRGSLGAGGRRAPFTLGRLMKMLAVGTVKTGTHPLPFNGSEPLLRKTSPSGGGRHPTETYIHLDGIVGTDPGWHHVDHYGGVLERLPMDVAPRHWCPVPDNCGVAYFLFTSRFYRNRYRYREPRTFRTVHMDVGHLLATIELLANSLGLEAYPDHLGDEAVAVGRVLELDPLIEWPLAGLSVFGEMEGHGA